MRRHLTVFAIVVAMVGLMAGFATVAQAMPTKTTACSGCHTTNAAVVLGVTQVSNNGTTATYNVTVSNTYGMVGWGAFAASKKVAGTAASPGSFVATCGVAYTVYGVSGNGNGTEGFSQTSFTPVAALPPAAPVIASTYNTSVSSATITWPTVVGATSYDYKVGSGTAVNTTFNTVTVSGLAAGSTAFAVRSVGAGGASVYTSATIVYTPPVVAPAAPVLSATYNTSNGSVTIPWTAVSGATSYDYQVGAGSVLSTTSTSVSLSGLSLGSTAFKVRATNTGGSSAYATATIVYTPLAPAAPVLPASINTSSTGAIVSWTAVSGATSYDYQIGAGSVVTTTSTLVPVTGLTPGSTAFKVRATNSGGSSAYATTSIVYTPPAPAAPVISATYNTSVNSVAISWATVSGATSYDYQVAAGSVVSTTATSVTVTGLSAGSTAFQVRATNAGGSSAYATSTIVYTVPVAPAAPVISPTYNTAANSVAISWAAVSGATSYDYQVAAGSVVSTTATSVTVTGLSAGSTAFKVRAVNAVGPSAYATATIVYTIPVAPPAAPSLAASYNTTSSSVTISWAAVSSASGYDYQVGAGSVLSTTSTSVTVTGLSVGTTTFKLRATNSAGPSAYSSANIVYTLPPAPSAPFISATYPTSDGTATIAWAPVSGATSYDYQVGAGSVVTTTSTSVTLKGLALGATAFKVRATNTGGSSAYASASVVYTPPAPTAPSINSTYTPAASSVAISWSAIPGATSYDYQIGAGSLISTTSTSVSVTGLVVGTTAFKVRATNSGGSSSYATASIVRTPPAPSAPVLSATYNTSTGSVAISWTAVSGATSYDYQVGTGSVLSTAGTSVSLSGLSIGSTDFKLRATNSGGSSAYTTATIVYTPPAPAAPVLQATYNSSDGNVTITWTAVSGATGYDYQVGSGAVTSTSNTSVSLSGLTLGSTAFKLRAKNTGGTSAYATASIVYAVPAPAAPVLEGTYNTTDGNVTISWAAVSGATSYDYQVGSGAVTSTSGNSVSLSGLSLGSTAFKLRATNVGGPSAYATSAIVYAVPVAPAAPSLAAEYLTPDGSVTIDWPAVAGATSYQYQVGGGVVMEIPDTSVTLYGMSSGLTSFKVRALNSAGTSAWTATHVKSTAPAEIPVLKLGKITSAKRRYITVRGTVTGGQPVGRLTIKVYVRIGHTKKYRAYTYYTDWSSPGAVGTFIKTVRVPKYGAAYAVVSGGGAKIKSVGFTIRR